jgi:hypothetical protein
LRKENDKHGKALGWLVLIPVLAVFALLLNTLDPASRRSRLYFADASGTRLKGETRRLALVGPVEDRARRVVEELLLGPATYGLRKITKGDVRLRSLMHRDGRLHIALDVPDLSAPGPSFQLLKQSMEKSIARSVGGSGPVDLYLNGRLMESAR